MPTEATLRSMPRVVPLSALSAPLPLSDPFEIAHVPTDHVGLIDINLYLYILSFVLRCVYIYMIWFIYEMINCCVLVVILMQLG